MSNKEIHGIVKADFGNLKNVSGEEIKGTTKIYVDVPVVPRWLSDQLTSFKKTTNNYDDFKKKFQYSLVVFVGTEKAKWIIDNQQKIDLAVALGVWVVEDD